MTDPAVVRGLLSDLGIDPLDLREVGSVQVFRGESGQLLPLWRRLRAAHERSGLWPLIMGADDNIAELANDYGRDPDREVAAGLAMDAIARLAQMRATGWIQPTMSPSSSGGTTNMGPS